MCHGHDLQVNETLGPLGEIEQVSRFRAEVGWAEPQQGEESECWLTWLLVVVAIETVVVPHPILVATGAGRLVVVVALAVVAETVAADGAAAEVVDVRRG